PVAAIYSTFLQRAYDQLVHDVCLQKLNVVLAMDRAGRVGDDGPTHHGAFDIAYLRCLPNIVLMAPRDGSMLVHMLCLGLAADDGFAKPIDAGLMAQLAAEHDLLVTVEEGVLAGGFGSAVWETLNEAGASPRILRVGLPDRYVTHGKPALLHEEVGYTATRIAERVAAAISARAHADSPGPARPSAASSAVVGA